MKILEIIKISRPRFWLYEFATFLFFGVFIAVSDFSSLSNIDIFIYGLYFLIPANILIYGINDIYDYETDKLNPKKVEYENLLEKSKHKILFYLIAATNTPFILYTLFSSISGQAKIAFFIFLFCAVFYSAKPIRAKAIPFLDSIFSAGHYVATGFFGYYLMGGQGFNFLIFFVGMLWCVAMHAYSAVPDIKADTDAKLKTIATTLGKRGTIYMCVIFYTLIASIFIFLEINYLSLLSLPYFYMMYISLKSKNSDELFTIYKYFPILNAVVGMFVTIYILLKII